jgi:DNA polymerase-3 subunit epsilon
VSRSKDAWAYHPSVPLRSWSQQEQITTVVGLYAGATTRVCVLDTETTGFSPERDRVIEICAAWVDLATGAFEVDAETGKPCVRASLINPGIAIPAAATKIHGIRNADVKASPRFDQVWPAVLSFIGDGPVLAHNASFDVRMLHAEAARTAIRTPHRVTVFCSKKLAKAVLPKGHALSLESVAKALGVPQRAGAHRAVADVETTGAVVARLCARGGKDLRELTTQEAVL